ncbi:unnamed protein product (mitochondrion) [Plasmodiophora brassicae]|uniref:DUF3719 domain-containing protein n=1 Tax=Plasmodiophora brassicae TaxID=37360 RepID=A0A0G4J3K8_PLABS|nr:hypothetical protein PBRA_002390 [Plasmodiophora brassicae]SPQ93684.1 unnamed protein product [Plasmodiophora brassicae]
MNAHDLRLGTASSLPSPSSVLTFDHDPRSSPSARQTVQSLLDDIEQALYDQTRMASWSRNDEVATRGQGAEIVSNDDLREWTAAFPHLNVVGVACGGIERRSDDPWSRVSPREGPMAPVAASLDTGLTVRGLSMTILSEGGELEEIIAMDGDAEQVFAEDHSRAPLSSVVHVPGVTDAASVRRIKRRQRRGHPPLTPSRLLVHSCFEDLFDALWAIIAQRLAPLLRLARARSRSPTKKPTDDCDPSALSSAMIIRSCAMMSRSPGRRSSTAMRTPTYGDAAWPRSVCRTPTAARPIQLEGGRNVTTPTPAHGTRPSTCTMAMRPASLQPTLQIVGYDHLYRAHFNLNRSKHGTVTKRSQAPAGRQRLRSARGAPSHRNAPAGHGQRSFQVVFPEVAGTRPPSRKANLSSSHPHAMLRRRPALLILPPVKP